MRALAARRAIDLVGLRLAPAITAALIVWSHTTPGQAAVVFVAVLVAGQFLERSPFPLALMPAARIVVALLAPVIGIALATVVMAALETPVSFADVAAAVVAAWLVLALGAWIRYRVDEVASARVAVIGERSFALDLAREFDAADVRDHRLAGWIGAPRRVRQRPRLARKPARGAPHRARAEHRADRLRSGRRPLRGRGARRLRDGRRLLPRPAGAR